MAKVIVEMEFDFEGFEKLQDVDKHGLVSAILESPNEFTDVNINIEVKSTRIVNKWIEGASTDGL